MARKLASLVVKQRIPNSVVFWRIMICGWQLLTRAVISGSNNPRRPQEACGYPNGFHEWRLNLSILDGWWPEVAVMESMDGKLGNMRGPARTKKTGRHCTTHF